MSDGVTLYDVLGVTRDAGQAEIHAAYRRAALVAHPDRGGDRAGWDRVLLARDVLTDADRRAAYDRDGTTGKPARDRDFEDAVGWVARALDDVMQRVAGEHCRVDVVARVRATLAQWLTEQFQREARARRDQVVLREVAARLVDEGERPVIGGIVDAKIRALEDLAVKALRNVEMIKAAATLVSHASYRPDVRVSSGRYDAWREVANVIGEGQW